MEDLIQSLLVVAIPFAVTKLWPILQGWVTSVKEMENWKQMTLITLFNGALAAAAQVLMIGLPDFAAFGVGDLSALLTALVGYLTTLVFKSGKAAGTTTVLAAPAAPGKSRK